LPNPTIEIAKKEFLENVLSMRFLIALGLSLLILTTSVLVLAANHRDDQGSFATNQASMEQMSENDFVKVSLQISRVIAKPNLLSIFTGGPGDEFRKSTDAMPFRMSSAETSGGSSSPTNKRFDPLDLGFVAAVVMTFMAVVFSYDAVSGERERGTLKLMLANPVPKDAVLFGKYLGGMASILLPFALSVVVALAALSLTGVRLNGDEWGRLGLILLLFVPLASAFYLLGLLVSSLSRKSSTSLLALTLVWLVLVFGAGNVAAVVAKETVATATEGDMQQAFAEVNERANAKSSSIGDELLALYELRQAQNGTLSAEDEARLKALEAAQSEVWKSADAERSAIVANARRKLDNQLARAETIASVSPAEAFRGLSTALARSDYWTYKDMSAAVEEYRKEVEKARAEWLADNPPPKGVGPGGAVAYTITIGGPAFSTNGPRFDPPLFRYEAQSVEEQLSSPSGARNLAVLVAYNVLAFLGAYAAFLRYDVR